MIKVWAWDADLVEELFECMPQGIAETWASCGLPLLDDSCCYMCFFVALVLSHSLLSPLKMTEMLYWKANLSLEKQHTSFHIFIRKRICVLTCPLSLCGRCVKNPLKTCPQLEFNFSGQCHCVVFFPII